MNLSLLRVLKVVAAAAVLLVPSGYACADEASFTKQIADRLLRELPGLQVEIASPLTLKINQADGAHILQANLDRIFAFCSKAAEQCDAATSQYIAGVSGAVKDRIRPIEPSMIRLNVRPRKGLQSAQQQLPPDAPRIVLRPFAGDLALTAVLDFPTAMRMFTNEDAKKLGMSEDQAIEIGRNNLRATLKPISDFPPPTAEQSFRYLGDSPYESSRMILHSEWAPVAKALGGSLIVGVPSSNLLVYGRGDSELAVDAIRAFVRDAVRKTDRPLSTSLFRWTENGWEEVR
ncbi:MAG: hypothetical protein R3E35_11835 [Rhodocyclaceae bacterium]